MRESENLRKRWPLNKREKFAVIIEKNVGM